jgi:thiamine kinase-like enzyme
MYAGIKQLVTNRIVPMNDSKYVKLYPEIHDGAQTLEETPPKSSNFQRWSKLINAVEEKPR